LGNDNFTPDHACLHLKKLTLFDATRLQFISNALPPLITGFLPKVRSKKCQLANVTAAASTTFLRPSHALQLQFHQARDVFA
jgi:hypothetical protein